MPLRLAHAASFQGHAMRLEVQPQGQVKMAGNLRARVNVFSNSYVGQLRRQVAQTCTVPAGNMRLLHGGVHLSQQSTGGHAFEHCHILAWICMRRPLLIAPIYQLFKFCIRGCFITS